MLVQFDCFKCIFNQIVEMARSSSENDSARRKMLKKFMALVTEYSDKYTPPEMAAEFYRIFCDETGILDPFAAEKRNSAILAHQLYGELENMVQNAADPFAMALRLAIGGNVIDFGATPDFQLSDAADAIRKTAAGKLDENALNLLREKAAGAKDIFYILDNCGEAVIDRLLIEQLGTDKVTLGVRGMPILNDITRNELTESNLADIPVIDTGDRSPGVSLKFSSGEFLHKLYHADLVIAKGQGNYESLYDAPDNDHIFFLFRVKCPVIEMQTGNKKGSLQIRQGINRKHA